MSMYTGIDITNHNSTVNTFYNACCD